MAKSARTNYPLGVEMIKGRIHPNLGSIQDIFFGRLYSSDMILLYRAITGRYVEYPSLFVMTAGLGVFPRLKESA